MNAVSAAGPSRARQRALVGVVFSVGMIVAMAMAPFHHRLLNAGPLGVSVFALGVLTTIVCVGAAGGKLLELWWATWKKPAVRAELWDELAQANNAHSLAVGYWCMWFGSLALLWILRFWPLSAHWALLAVFGMGAVGQAVAFAVFERKGDDAGN